MRAHFYQQHCHLTAGAPVVVVGSGSVASVFTGRHLMIVLMMIAIVAASPTTTQVGNASPHNEQQAQQSRSQQQQRQAHLPNQQPQAPQQQQQQQQQLGGKCAQMASCHLRGRRRDLDVGPDSNLRSCYCDQRCTVYDDCCTDAPTASSLAARAHLGFAELKRRRQQWHCHRVNPIFGDILLRATCEPGWLSRQSNQELARQVQRSCEYVKDRGKRETAHQADPIGMMMPITDLTTGTTYANSYCLRCNDHDHQERTPSPVQLRNSSISAAAAATPINQRKLVYWSPLLECTYNLDSDDRNTLWDLVSSQRGQALRYSSTRNKWLISTTAANSATTGEATERVCSITPAVPDSVEHIVRYCRARTIDTCPEPQSALGESAEQIETRAQCELGHQALTYSQTSSAVYRNLACARCNRQRQVFCEPRLRKNLLPSLPVSRVLVASHQGNSSSDRVVFAPPDDQEEPTGGSSEESSDEGVGSRSGGQAGAAISGSFSVLMDLYGGSPDDEQVGAVHQCASAPGQVYDPFFLTCRDVVCGLNHRFANGRCIELSGANNSSGGATLAAPDHRLAGSSSESSSGFADQLPKQQPPEQQQHHHHHRQQVAARLTEAPENFEQVSTGRSSAVHEASARLIGNNSAGEQQSQTTSTAAAAAAASNQPQLQVVVHGVGGEEAMKNEPSLLAATQLALSQLSNQAVSGESRRAFAECGKILIQTEHYRLFSILTSDSSTLTNGAAHSPATTNLSAAGAEDDNRLLLQWHRERGQVNRLWAFVAPYNLTLASSQFELIRSPSNSSTAATNHRQTATGAQFNLLICSPFSSDLVAKFKPAMVYITSACLAVSIASLALYLALYLLSMCDLRHLAVDMASHCCADSVQGAKKQHLDNKHRPSRASSETQSSLLSSATNRAASQSLSSRGVACLSSSLLAAYLLFIAGNQRQASSPLTCFLIALATYYCFLVAFNWMFLLAYDIWRTLRLATCQLRGPAQHSQSRRFLSYSLFALLSSALVVGLAIAVDLTPLACEQQQQQTPSFVSASQSAPVTGAPVTSSVGCNQADALSQLVHTYRPKFGQRMGACWFANRRALALFFGLPVTLIMLVNLLFFLHSSFMVIRTSSRSSRQLNQQQQQQHQSLSSKQRDARTREWTQDHPARSVDSNGSHLNYASSSSSSSGEDSPPPAAQDGATAARRPLETGLSSSSLTNQSIASSFATRYDAHLASLSCVMGSLVKDYRLYCRLSTIMGLTWLTGLMASVVDQSDVLWYLFVVLNTLQGLFIFIAFGCKRSKLVNLNLLLNYLRYRWQRQRCCGA